MTDTPEFRPFPKIPRLTRGVIVTEKIDGTNAAVHITEGGRIFAQSRNRFVTPTDDNYGFARWVEDNAFSLASLGAGVHYGEWWGQGIQRRYGILEKRFSLFNTGRWLDNPMLPTCCHVVPVLYEGLLDEAAINGALVKLLAEGSVAAPGFLAPEGIIVFHKASGQMFKKTALGEDGHKETT